MFDKEILLVFMPPTDPERNVAIFYQKRRNDTITARTFGLTVNYVQIKKIRDSVLIINLDKIGICLFISSFIYLHFPLFRLSAAVYDEIVLSCQIILLFSVFNAAYSLLYFQMNYWRILINQELPCRKFRKILEKS